MPYFPDDMERKTKQDVYETALVIARKWKLEHYFRNRSDVKQVAELISPTDPESKLKPGQNPSHWGNAAWALWHSILYLLSQPQIQKGHKFDPKAALQFTWLVQSLLTCKKCRNSFEWFLQHRKITAKTIATPQAWSRLFNDAHNFVNLKHNIASVDRIAALDIKSIDKLPIPPNMPPRELLDLPPDVMHARLTKRVVPYKVHLKLMAECAQDTWMDALFTLLYYWFEHYPDEYLEQKAIKDLRSKYKQFITLFCNIFRPLCPEFIDMFRHIFDTKSTMWDHSLFLLITLNGFERTWKHDLASEAGCDASRLERWKPLNDRLDDVRESMKEALSKLNLKKSS